MLANTSAVVRLTSPDGIPVDLHLTPESERDEIITLLERVERLGDFYIGKGWTFRNAAAVPAGPSATELSQGPTFCGFPCSPTVDQNGYPSWILVGGRQAMRREKQGDVWYSVKEGDTYDRVLTIPKGEIVPAVMSPDDRYANNTNGGQPNE